MGRIDDPSQLENEIDGLVNENVAGPNFTGSDGNDVFYVRRHSAGTNVLVFDNEAGTGTPIFSAPIDTAPVLAFNMLGGDDRLIVDATSIPTGGISYAGGANNAGGDRLILRNGRNTAGSFRPDSGVVNVSGRRITLSDVEPIDVKLFSEFTVTTPNSSDMLTFTGTGTDAMQLAGTSGALTLQPVTFTGVSSLIIDAAANDTGSGNDSLTINASGTVPGSDGYIEYRSGTGTLTVQNGSARINSTGSTLDTNVATGAELITNRFQQNGLTLADGARAVIVSGGGTSVLTSLSLGTNATLDINDNAVIVNYMGESPEAAIRDKIIEGRGSAGIGNGVWTDTGIISTTAAAANVHNPESRSIGYANNGSLPLGGYRTFRGRPLDATSIVITYTVTGDANLDGKVDDNDVTIIGANYRGPNDQPHWALGDFDYNGLVGDDDITLVGALYKTDQVFSHPGPAPPALSASDALARGVAIAETAKRSRALIASMVDGLLTDPREAVSGPRVALSEDLTRLLANGWLRKRIRLAST